MTTKPLIYIYFCQRYDEPWSGGLIIQAKNKQEANNIFSVAEGHNPININKLDTTKAIIYNDAER